MRSRRQTPTLCSAPGVGGTPAQAMAAAVAVTVRGSPLGAVTRARMRFLEPRSPINPALARAVAAIVRAVKGEAFANLRHSLHQIRQIHQSISPRRSHAVKARVKKRRADVSARVVPNSRIKPALP